MIANSIIPVPLPDGIYCGTWSSMHICINVNREEHFFKVDKTIGRGTFPCIIIIENKAAFVDSGNPVAFHDVWKEKAQKWDMLRDKIAQYYLKPGDEGYDPKMDENGLLGIGEEAATAFGFF